MSSVRALEFLEMKFGKNRKNRNNIAKLLEEYRNWEPSVDTDNIDIVKACDDMGIRNDRRLQMLVDSRLYVSVYCYVYRGMKVGEIAKMFGKNHSSISVLIRSYESRYNDKKFMIVSNDISERYGLTINPEFAIKVINEKRR
jgi:hypothetical protein